MMSEVKLPELPTPPLRFGIAMRDGDRLDYSAKDMREYASAAVLAERERCAKVCETLISPEESGIRTDSYADTAWACAFAIRGKETTASDAGWKWGPSKG
jgi:hypothetical protein